MTYLGQAAIADNASMMKRVAQCAAEQDIPDPDAWTSRYRRTWAAAPGWADAWASALASHEGQTQYDPGADEAVITDAMILGQVQTMKTEQAIEAAAISPPAPPSPAP